MSNDRLESVDLAEMNLAVAEGLRGAEKLDTRACLRKLAEWTGRVRSETAAYTHLFERAPAAYENSLAYFKVLTLITVLQQDFGAAYDQKRIREVDFTDSRDLFIHGLLLDGMGTCLSMPALYVAVGQRLGYPLYLAIAKGHVFARWDDPQTGERFNIEGTNRGLTTPPDEEYRAWPDKLTEDDLSRGVYLRSLDKRQSLAVFLESRGACLEDNGRLGEARVAYALAHRLWPENREAFKACLITCLKQRHEYLLPAEWFAAVGGLPARQLGESGEGPVGVGPR